VSQQLAILEREARAKLLERVGRRVRLTAGANAWPPADAILQAVVAAEQDLKGAKENQRVLRSAASRPSPRHACCRRSRAHGRAIRSCA
jgi:DNA-binding transcriptional LysR family regulator